MVDSASGSDSDDGINDEDPQYIVKKICADDEFDNLVSRCLNKEVVFQPESLWRNETEHSKRVYLVHWKSYNRHDRTWEPEQNLLKLALLDDYKQRKGYPHVHGECETFIKKYDYETKAKMASWNLIGSENLKKKSEEYKKAKRKEAEEAQKVAASKSKSRESVNEKQTKKDSVPRKEAEDQKVAVSKSKSRESVNEKQTKKDSVPRKRRIELQSSTNQTILDNIPEALSTSVRNIESNNNNLILPIRSKLPHRSFATHLELRMKRRCASAENLNQRWNDKAEVELLNRAHFMINDCCGDDEVKTARVLITETGQHKVYISKREKEEKIELANRNKAKARTFLSPVQSKLKSHHLDAIDVLVSKYTQDCFEDCKQILEQFPNSWRLVIIQCLIMACKTYSTFRAQQRWINRSRKLKRGNEFLFLESDEDVKTEFPSYVEKCSEQHTKCTWLGIFLGLLPDGLRFEESSGFSFSSQNKTKTDIECADGPFRDDLFLHCMKYGADCQKLKFLMYGTPLGNSEAREGSFNVSYVHLVLCQGSSLKRVQQFVAAGFDIHPLATQTETGRLLELSEYIDEYWRRCKENKEEKQQKIDDSIVNYYQKLPEMIQKLSEKLRSLVTCEHERSITLRGEMRMLIDMSISYPHILHCNPAQNVENGGEGEYQVETCLFFEHGCSYKNGLREESLRNKGEIRCAKVLEKCRETIRRKDGRFVLCVYRVKIKVIPQDKTSEDITLPVFEFVRSDDKMTIDNASVIPMNRVDVDDPRLEMIELVNLRAPGQRFYVFDKLEIERDLLKPGSAHIELRGRFDAPMNFIVQLIFVTKKK